MLLAFAAVLLVAVLFSALADRTILSTSALFLIAGIALGTGGLGILDVKQDDEIVGQLAELALFAVLFTDGMKAGWHDLRSAWKLPGRALLFGLPLTLLFTAVLAHLAMGMSWPIAFLVGAILSPTDPVFASALVGNDKVPERLRRLLNVESGVNDGLALPFVIVLLAAASSSGQVHALEVGIELVVGLLIGVVVPWVVVRLEGTRMFAASGHYEPLTGVAVGLLVLALGQATHGNLFLAAFAAGITLASVGPRQHESFEEFGELVAELLKLVALLVFGALVTRSIVTDIGIAGVVFAVLALFLPRPLALTVSFLRSGLAVREQVAASWFGPKGFASVVYALYVLSSGIPDAQLVFDLVAATVVLSILLHSSTDVVVARWFDDEDETPNWHERRRTRRAARITRGRNGSSRA
ncbi:cation:proton antiporter [Gephyromycinifex aptenodytis]|uniref:cation:proton antiporter n=1 Tax=Gephyromycinifex aptenodytis TaxID=2716227 RepID=UPI0014487414|nr:cation:proton antiporter [Gephyromycinifex aptenodytis]